MKKQAALCSIGVLLTVVAEAGPIQWVSAGPPGNPSITAMAVVQSLGGPSSALFAGTTSGGAWRSDDAGRTWAAQAGLPARDVIALTAHYFVQGSLGRPTFAFVTTLYAGTVGGGVFRLDQGSMSWAAVNNGLTSLSINALLVLPGGWPMSATLLAGTADGLFKSADSGNTWSPRMTGLPSGSDGTVLSLAADPGSSSTVYAGTRGSLFESKDAGETWTKLDTGGSFKFSVSTIAVDPIAPSHLYAAGFVTFVLFPSFPTALRSLDGGASWTTMDLGAGSFARAFAVTPNLPSRVFAGTAGNGVVESADGGVTWTVSNDGLGNASVSSLVIDPTLPSLIFAGTAYGVFSASLGQVAEPCVPSTQTICLNARRFSASVVWRVADGATGNGQALAITDNTGAFWFFDPTNLELVLKVLDGRSINGRFWVFYGSLTNVEFTLTVTDMQTGAVKTYVNPQGQLASIADTSAF